MVATGNAAGEAEFEPLDRFLFLWFQGPCIFAFICYFTQTRAGVALCRVGFSPASAAAMVRGEKASAFWSALRVGDRLPGLVLIGWRLVPKMNLPSTVRSQSSDWTN